MSNSLFFCGVVATLLSTVTSAQSQAEYELAHEAEENERRATVAANLPILESEADVFWNLYLEYRAADKEMDDRRANLILRFAESYEDLAEDEGNRLVVNALELEEQRQLLKKSYFKKFADVLPGQRLFRYYQIETRLDAKKRHNWTSNMPLVLISVRMNLPRRHSIRACSRDAMVSLTTMSAFWPLPSINGSMS